MITKQKRSEIEQEYRKSLEVVVYECAKHDHMTAAAIAKMLGIDIDDVMSVEGALKKMLSNERAHKARARPGNKGGKPRKKLLWDGEHVTFEDIARMTGLKRSNVIKKLSKAGILAPLSQIPDGLFTKVNNDMGNQLTEVNFGSTAKVKITERQWICLYIEFWRNARGAEDMVIPSHIGSLPDVAKNWCKQHNGNPEHMRLSYSHDSIVLHDMFDLIPALEMHK